MFLITGATGNNGQEIVKQLVAAGQCVRILVRDPQKAADLQALGVEIATGDLDHPDTLDRAFESIEKALLLPANSLQQVEQEQNFIDAAKRADTMHIVKFSAAGADRNSPIQILNWHGQAEQYLEQSGIPFTHLRPVFFMQNLLQFAAPTQNEIYLPFGDATVAMVDIRDIAAVVVKALIEPEHEGKAYTITGAEALTMHQAVDRISQVRGRPLHYVAVTAEGFKQGLLQWGQPEWLAGALSDLLASVAEGRQSAVTTAIADVAQKQPISFAQFTQDYASAFKG
ncbi:NAD(P)H azoreductase [Acaryochloris thomasi RCC1774]|uniref:NAD(P)H azoreductase n=1 Tax=Acaryochloris thomasi RCC1774 TaxID=1764569 RepID=A0A2W1J7N7_9CYAN|nr:SDR family oxidoreductase [Acaryochloris thomasi]PZD70483.1 NAD(P)H azoreductase [Acaryochloris thomasi RCC1774]